MHHRPQPSMFRPRHNTIKGRQVWRQVRSSGSTLPKDLVSSSRTAAGKDVFVHISAVERAGFSSLAEGAKVSYEVVANRGKESAEDLKIG